MSLLCAVFFFFVKQKTAYEMRISDWSPDGFSSDLIRPDLAHAPDAMPAQIAAILAHELVHTAVGIPAGHGKAFKRIALGLGLVGPMRATTPGEAFLAAVAPILDAVGPLPHAR